MKRLGVLSLENRELRANMMGILWLFLRSHMLGVFYLMLRTEMDPVDRNERDQLRIKN